MLSCENVIVSVSLNNEMFDMELPAFLPLKEVRTKIEETLRTMRPDLLRARLGIILTLDGKVLDEERCLAHYGAWDGSNLVCVYESGGSK